MASTDAPQSLALVHIVDDDAGVRSALSNLLCSVGYTTALHATASEFMESSQLDQPGCLVLDVRLPGASGLDLQEHLNSIDIGLPLILMTAHGDIQMAVKAMKAGAVDFLTKPFRDQDMLDAVSAAVEIHRSRRNGLGKAAALRQRYELLTARERQVFDLACSGRLNKQIAADLGITEVTVKFHRSSAMKKMSAKSLAELARMAEILHLHR